MLFQRWAISWASPGFAPLEVDKVVTVPLLAKRATDSRPARRDFTLGDAESSGVAKGLPDYRPDAGAVQTWALQSAAEIRTQSRSVEARQASRFTLSLFRFGGDI